MSLNEFIELVHNVNDSRPLLQYLETHMKILSPYQHSNDLYGMILKSLITKDCHEYIKTKYPWKYVSQIISQMNSIEITSDDLGIDRMEGLVDIFAYFNLVINFLETHDIHEIPESCIVYYERFDTSFLNVLPSKIVSNFNVNSIKLFSLFLTRYNRDLKNFTFSNQHHLNTEKNILFDAIRQPFEMYFDDVQHNDDKKTYKNNIVDNDNIIEIFFDIYKSRDIGASRRRTYISLVGILNLLMNIYDKKDISHNITSQEGINLEIIFHRLQMIANYFEYMRIDQQIMFWNILMNDHRVFIGLLAKYSSSDVFITYAFEEFADLHDKSKLSKIIFQSNGQSNIIYHKPFFNLILKKFPEMKDDIIIHYVFNNLSFCFYLFPELYEGDSQLITDAFDRKLLSGCDFFP